MTHLLRLELKWIVVLDEEDTEIMIDREHFEDWLKQWGESNTFTYWDRYWLDDTLFQSDVARYVKQHHTLNTIEGLKIPLT